MQAVIEDWDPDDNARMLHRMRQVMEERREA